jgi:glyoxylase-like metal-dependent hydrolase (beta-lactamase superfamily II)
VRSRSDENAAPSRGASRSDRHTERVPSPTRISEHVVWLPPAPPDRPSLCAVVGTRRTLMLDGGASPAHARELLLALDARPAAVVYTHSHWDHVFGGAEVGAPIVAHRLTAERLVDLAASDWSDEALERRVAAGELPAQYAADIKEELPAPRRVDVAPADVLFDSGLVFELGGVRVVVRHVGGDHAHDSSVAFVEPDRVLFLGDCLCEAQRGGVTAELALPLHETILSFGAQIYVEGHHDALTSPAELDAYLAELRALATPRPPSPA